MDRALNGVEVPIYAYGKIIGTRTVYNDRLLMFMLRNRAPKRFAADGARGLNAVDKQMLAKLKKEWRAEWEAEEFGNEQDVLDSIDEKIDRMKAEWQSQIDNMSGRARAAYEEYKRLEALDRKWSPETLVLDGPDGGEKEASGPKRDVGGAGVRIVE